MSIVTATASELGRKIGTGELDPVEINEAFLGEIDRCEHAGDIYSYVSRERAVFEAKAASLRAKKNERLGLFDGVPVSWKDLFDTRDIPTESGSRLLKGRVPVSDCEVATRASNAGMICLGKTHLSELAFSGLGINPMTATSPNRYDKNLAPGGSSSGAAASVAYNLAPIAIGSDTGGSVRIPSSWNDLVGLKTTHGKISLNGVVPLCSSFDTVGPLARSVEDAFEMYKILSGEYSGKISPREISSLRFLVCQTNTLNDCDDQQLRAFENAIYEIEKAGATVERAKIPEFEEMVELGPIMFPHEAYNQWGREIESDPEQVFAPVRARFLAGKNISEEENAVARERMMQLRQLYNNRTAQYDAVLAPTTPIGPPDVQTLLDDHDLFWDTNLRALSNTRYGNMFGLCGLTLPTKFQSAGLMLLAAPGQDMALLQMGAAIESIIGG